MTSRPIIALVNRFFADLSRNRRKDTPYPRAELARLLQESGFVIERERE